MRRSAEIDKLLRKQREASDGERGPRQKRRRVGIEARLKGLGADEDGIDATGRGGGGGEGRRRRRRRRAKSSRAEEEPVPVAGTGGVAVRGETRG